jgi:hypothetical protein
MWINKNVYKYEHKLKDNEIIKLKIEINRLNGALAVAKAKETPVQQTIDKQTRRQMQALESRRAQQSAQLQGGLGGFLGHSPSNPCGFVFG